MKLFYSFTLACCAVATTIVARENALRWTQSPFDQKVFIENAGQFDGVTKDESHPIVFGTTVDGVDLHFHRSGLTYRHLAFTAMPDDERRAKGIDKEEAALMAESKIHELSLEWVDANPLTTIIADDSVPFYYTYGAKEATILAHAYRKITYKNLYPGIDVAYVFPDGKEGVKYSFILHPGADVSRIKMRYGNAEQVVRDQEGNVTIASSFGKFIDHAPVTSYADGGSAISSAFIVSGNEVSFALQPYDRTRTIVIDPWTINPGFAFNSAYDVNCDLEGNVYVLGSYNHYKLAKFDNAGAVKWIYTSAVYQFSTGVYFYGDFAVDEVSGTSYIVEGYNTNGGRVWKINTAGTQVAFFPGNPNMQEMWRAEYNRCLNKIVVGGGGTTQGSYNAYVLDTNLVVFSLINIFSALHIDIALMAFDNTSNYCFMAPSGMNNPQYDNHLVKLPIPLLIPLQFSVPDGYQLRELGSVTYVNYTTNPYCLPNGMNGMAVSSRWVYTYDSDIMKRWNTNDGTLIAQVHASNRPPQYSADGGILVSWGGLAVDMCENTYVGVEKTIKVYNSSFLPVDTIVMPGTVYDIKMGPNGTLYACGKKFVAQLDISPVALTITKTSASCKDCNGTASVNVCGGDTSAFTYSWNTTPVQTTRTATGLCPGTYKVTATTNCYMSYTDSVTIPGGVIPTISGTTTLCEGDSTTLTASGGTAYVWNTGATIASITVRPLTTTTYIVTVSNDSGCSASDTVVVTVNPRPLAEAGADVTLCFGDSTQLNASGGTRYSWQPTTGLSDPTIANPIAKPTVTTTYTVTVSNANLCSNKDNVVVTVLPQMTYSLMPNPINLGVTKTGASKSGKATFTNQNDSRVHINDIHFIPSSFGTITTPFPRTLSAGESIDIQFTATAPDTFLYQADLCVEIDSACQDKRCIPISIEGASTCLTPQVASATVGKRPGEEVVIPIILDPSSKFTNAKTIELKVKYDPALLRFVRGTSSLDPSPEVRASGDEIVFTISPQSPLPTPSARIAELHMQALLAPYAEGEIDVTSSLVTLKSGEQIAGTSCPEKFSLDSSCVRPSHVKIKGTAIIEGIYPNPSWINAQMVVVANHNPHITIDIYDVFGRKVETLFNGILEDGTHKITINTEKYSTGIYFCRLLEGNHVTTKEFNVER